MSLLGVVIVLFLCNISIGSTEFDWSTTNVEIRVEEGLLRGVLRQSTKDKTFRAFYGIPYAEPPVGILRFEPSIPVKHWDGILDATKPQAICPQPLPYQEDLQIRGHEDCLYLNVYTPLLSETENELPVMFFIHGGAWMSGSGNPDLYGPDILLNEDIVLVTINYRLGALGFFSAGDNLLPGNNGLKDQVLALKWVKNNIRQFGGNPNRITVFGQSVGAASSHFHMLSPLSKDLINGVLAQSGDSTVFWALSANDETQKNSKKLATLLNCPTEITEEMKNCLQKVEVNQILEQDRQFMEWSTEPMAPFKPVIENDVEGAFLSKHPINIIKANEAADVPLIMGSNSEDGAIKIYEIYNRSELVYELNKNFNKIAPILMQYKHTVYNADVVSNKIRAFYFGDKDTDNLSISELIKMCTDSFLMHTVNTLMEIQAKYSSQPIYSYIFGYPGSLSCGQPVQKLAHNYGVCHGDELLYLFSSDISKSHKFNESEIYISDVLATLWTNFGKYGNPTPQTSSLIPNVWEPVKSNNLNYYLIKSDKDIAMSKFMFSDRLQLWKNLSSGKYSTKVFDEL